MLLKIQNQWINPQAISRLYKTSSDQFNVEFVHGGLFCCTYIDANREQNAADCERDLQRILEAVNGHSQITFTLPTEPVGGCSDFQVVSSEQAVKDLLQPAPVVVGRSNQDVKHPGYPRMFQYGRNEGDRLVFNTPRDEPRCCDGYKWELMGDGTLCTTTPRVDASLWIEVDPITKQPLQSPSAVKGG